MPYVVIALGANLKGVWGTPNHTIRRAVKELNAAGLTQISCSPFYHTVPLGGGMQAPYYNIVLTAVTCLLPNPLLRIIKNIENNAGRRFSRHWGARELDIDIIDYNGLIVRWPPVELWQTGFNRGRRQCGRLILPHPQAHLRRFVLQPLRDIAPHWVHRAKRAPLSQLIARLPGGRDVVRLDFVGALKDGP